MKLHNSFRAVLSTAIVLVSAGSASGQAVSFNTTGAFSGGCSGLTCSFGDYTIGFTGVTTSTSAPTGISLGQFTVVHTNNPSGPTSPPPGTLFSLTVTQTSPTGGFDDFSGLLQGYIGTSGVGGPPTGAHLYWTPGPANFVIGAFQYSIFTQTNGDCANCISLFQTDTPGSTQNTGVSGQVLGPGQFTPPPTTGTPEPSTVLLLAQGLIGVVGVARFRRRNVKATA